VPGNKWFDRERMFYQDYGYSETYSRINQDVRAPTIYELLSDRYTVSIQSPLTRGATRTYDNLITASITWYLSLLDWTDRLGPLRYEEIAQEVSADPHGQWPKFVHSYFPAVDEYAHRYGCDSWQYKYAVKNADQQIGRICGGLMQAGLFDKTTLVLVSDHGIANIDHGQRFNVGKGLTRQFGRKPPATTWPELSTNYYERKEYLDRYDTVVAPDGCRKCAVYLRFAEPWSERPVNVEAASTYALAGRSRGSDGRGPAVEAMAQWLGKQPAVWIAAVPAGPGEVALYGAAGVTVATRRGAGKGATYRYAVRGGADPLGYQGHPVAGRLIDGAFHSADAWFSATVETAAPDIPGQICEMFDSPRAGEIVLFAAAGWGFSQFERAGHGSITAEEMFVPMIWAGPGIAAGGKVVRARNCDVAPTILDILGVSDRLANHPPMDGVSLLPKLRKSANLLRL
jgi:arylsulfatase A-like enzyme